MKIKELTINELITLRDCFNKDLLALIKDSENDSMLKLYGGKERLNKLVNTYVKAISHIQDELFSRAGITSLEE